MEDYIFNNSGYFFYDCSQQAIQQALGDAIRLGDLKEVETLAGPKNGGRNILKSNFQLSLLATLNPPSVKTCEHVRFVISALNLAIICGHNDIVNYIVSNAFPGGNTFVMGLLSDKTQVQDAKCSKVTFKK